MFSIDFNLIVMDAALGPFSDASKLSIKEERQGSREHYHSRAQSLDSFELKATPSAWGGSMK